MIEKKSLPSNHPSLAVTYHNTSKALENLDRYPEACENQKHAVDIVRKTYESNDPQRQREEQDFENYCDFIFIHQFKRCMLTDERRWRIFF